ncbi:MAG: DUF1015 domain-containing protein [Acidobacteria bacterium]|nr:DUF1015 domain-containing protein [Acidobacteriota bacterium]
MAIVKPFRALRPNAENVQKVASVPYDVIYEEEVRTVTAENPLSFLRISRAEAECENSVDTDHRRSQENFEDFIERGILIQDDDPAIYVYRLTATDGHAQTGIVAGCSLTEYETGKIKRHEKTRPDKVEDRKSHMLALRAQTGLIFLAYRETSAIDEIISVVTSQEPLFDFVADDGVRQTVWKISETEAIVNAFAEVEALYVADGHHRIESAYQARNSIGNTTSDSEHEYVMAGVFPACDLRILAYNRIVRGYDDLSDADILDSIAANFSIVETSAKIPVRQGDLCMYLGGKWYEMSFIGTFSGDAGPTDRLDVSIVQHYIMEPVFGIGDPRTDERIGFVGGARGTEELEHLVDSGEARVAFSLFPTTMNDLLTVSDMGEIMPPKSTWFEPKLKDGLFIHRI